MIVRDVLKHPELIENFDWWNDGDDTIDWLWGFRFNPCGPRTEVALALVEVMQDKRKEFWKKRKDDFKASNP